MAVLITHLNPGRSVPRMVTGPTAGITPALPDHVRFSASPTTPDSSIKTPEKLGFFKSLVKQISSFILGCLPKSLYHWAESRTLYVGSRIPALKVTLNECKKEQNLSNAEKDLLHQLREVWFQSAKGVKNYGWYYSAQSGKPTFLLSMGNAWSLAGMLHYTELMKQGYGFLAYEYPGYGNTPGKPTEEALYKSLEAASDFLDKEKGIPINQQIAYGISLGGAVTTHVATKRPFKALILESTMTSFTEVVKAQLSKILPSWLLPLHEHVESKLDSLSKIDKVRCPLLVMSATADPLMPSEFSKSLYAKAGTPKDQKTLKLYPVGNHHLSPSLSTEGIKAFLDKVK